MAHYFWITGTGGGIGRALAQVLLRDNENRVFGLSRQNSISHPNFQFLPCDLSVPESSANFNFPQLDDAQSLTLINNAALIGDIAPVGFKSSFSIQNLYQVNLIAPTILSQHFAMAYQNHPSVKIILNVSSGAGRHPIESMSDYCASKAALDHFSRTMDLEQQWAKHPIHVFSVAPGVVDTPMQDEIRAAQPNRFKDHDFFVSLKKNHQLDDATDSAIKLLQIHAQHQKMNQVVLDVRDLL